MNLLICWHHGQILDLANELLARDGIADPNWVRAINEQLMFDDTVEPPGDG